MSRLTFSLAPFLGSIVLSGCAHDRPAPVAVSAQEPAPIDGLLPPPGVVVAGPLPGSPTTAVPIQPTKQPQSDAIDNGKIVRFTESANSGEIKQAELALRRTSDPAVRKLAQMMIDDHKQALTDVRRVAAEQKLRPSASEMSDQLEADAEKVQRDLQSKYGTEFDRAYVDAQVKEHQQVLSALDDKLLPDASNASLKATLVKIRPAVQMHLDHAKSLQSRMGK